MAPVEESRDKLNSSHSVPKKKQSKANSPRSVVSSEYRVIVFFSAMSLTSAKDHFGAGIREKIGNGRIKFDQTNLTRKEKHIEEHEILLHFHFSCSFGINLFYFIYFMTVDASMKPHIVSTWGMWILVLKDKCSHIWKVRAYLLTVMPMESWVNFRSPQNKTSKTLLAVILNWSRMGFVCVYTWQSCNNNNIQHKDLVWSKSPEATRSQIDLKRLYLESAL